MADRPILIAIIAIITILVALSMAIMGVTIAIGSELIPEFDDPTGLINSQGMIQGVGFIIVGLIAFVVGYGFWRGWKLFWYIGVILYAIAVIAAVCGLILGESISVVTLVISIVILFYLSRPKVRAFFKV